MAVKTGQSLSEYGLILGLVVVLSIPVVMTLGAQSTQNLGSVATNRSQLDRLSGLLGAPALTSSGSAAPSSPATAATSRALPPGRPYTLNGTALSVSRDANGLLRLQTADPNNGNVSSVEGGTVTRLLAQQLQDLANQSTAGSNGSSNSLLTQLANRFFAAANIQAAFDHQLTDVGTPSSPVLDSTGLVSVAILSETRTEARDFLTQGRPFHQAVTHYNDLVAFLEAHPELTQDPRIKPLIELGVGIYHDNYTGDEAVRTKLTQQTQRLLADVPMSNQDLLAVQRDNLQELVIATVSSERESNQTPSATSPPPGLNPPEIDPQAGATETRQVAKETERHSTGAKP